MQDPRHLLKKRKKFGKIKSQFSTSTGCPNKFGTILEMFVSEASYIYKQIWILLQKIAFWSFFRELQNENGFMKQLFSMY